MIRKKLKGKQNRRNLSRNKNKTYEHVRYYDMRLVGLFLVLTTFILLVRLMLCSHFGFPFFNEVNPAFPDDYIFIGHEGLCEQYNKFEGWLCIAETFTSIYALNFFEVESLDKNGKYNTESIPISTWLYNLSMMALSPIIIYRPTTWWIGYCLVMIIFSAFIGKFIGFAFPVGRELLKHVYESATDITVYIRNGGKLYFPGKSAIYVSVFFMIGLYWITIYIFLKAL